MSSIVVVMSVKQYLVNSVSQSTSPRVQVLVCDAAASSRQKMTKRQQSSQCCRRRPFMMIAEFVRVHDKSGHTRIIAKL